MQGHFPFDRFTICESKTDSYHSQISTPTEITINLQPEDQAPFYEDCTEDLGMDFSFPRTVSYKTLIVFLRCGINMECT